MVKKEFMLINLHGLHVRASNKLVECASSFISETLIHFNNNIIDAKRILQVMTMGAKKGDWLTIEISGPDEDKAVEKITALIEDGFGELDNNNFN